MCFIICYHYQAVHQGCGTNKYVSVTYQCSTAMQIGINIRSTSDDFFC